MFKVKICPNCGAKARKTDLSCSSCGFPLVNQAPIPSSQKKEQRKRKQRENVPPAAPSQSAPSHESRCPSCGKEIASSILYCPFCGVNLEARKSLAPAAVFQEPVLGEVDTIFEEPLEVEKETEREEAAITKQELLEYLKTMKGLAQLLKESPQYDELLKEAIADATDYIFLRAFRREELTNVDAKGYAIKALARACQRHNIPLPPEWHEKPND